MVQVFEREQQGKDFQDFLIHYRKIWLVPITDVRKSNINVLIGRCIERSSSDGVSVEVPSQYCDPVEKPIEEDTCHLFCSNECVLSEWSPWTSCKHVVSTVITNEIELIFFLLLSFQSKNCIDIRFYPISVSI